MFNYSRQLYFGVPCPAVAQARCGGEADPIVSCPVVRCRSTDITCSVGLSNPHEDAAYISVFNLHRLRSFFAIAHRCCRETAPVYKAITRRLLRTSSEDSPKTRAMCRGSGKWGGASYTHIRRAWWDPSTAIFFYPIVGEA